MEKLNFNRNVLKIEVNDDGEYITLNLSDSSFPKRFMSMRKTIMSKMDKFDEQLKELAAGGLPEEEKNERAISISCDAHKIIADEIDELFGAETCRKVFGNIVPDTFAIAEFMEAITPYFQRFAAHNKKYSPYRTGES